MKVRPSQPQMVIIGLYSLVFLGVLYFVMKRDGSTVKLSPPSPVQEITPPRNVKVKAAIVVLARNRDAEELRKSMLHMENRFNSRYRYPYVMLNEEPFSEEFKSIVQSSTKSKRTGHCCPSHPRVYGSYNLPD